MLEQAIIDAAALRNAAIQSAEQVVVEQYSEQIKQTVEQLLEQEEQEPKDSDKALTKDLNSQLPESYHPEIDDNKIIEIDLHSLEPRDVTKEDIKFASDEKIVEEDEEAELEENEEVELEEDTLEELSEALKFDYKRQPDGGFANGQIKPVSSVDDTVMVAEIAAMVEEYSEELEKENKDLKKENKQLKAKNKNLIEKSKVLFGSIKEIKEKFDEVQLMNAKLHYTNLALVDASLNERQKNNIVESINRVSSIEQAKIVYETLQGGVRVPDKSVPKSLSEVVSNRSATSILLHSRKDEDKKEDSDFAKRMRRLAGINN